MCVLVCLCAHTMHIFACLHVYLYECVLFSAGGVGKELVYKRLKTLKKT